MEPNHDTTHKEFLAVVWDVFLLRQYLEVVQLEFRNNHDALNWILDVADASGKLVRCHLRLPELELDVEDRHGIKHRAVDALLGLLTDMRIKHIWTTHQQYTRLCRRREQKRRNKMMKNRTSGVGHSSRLLQDFLPYPRLHQRQHHLLNVQQPSSSPNSLMTRFVASSHHLWEHWPPIILTIAINY